MLAQAGAAEVDALPVALAQVAGQGIAVRSLERDAVVPERGLRGADFRRTFVARAVVAHLRHEPRRVPPDLAARLADDALEVLAIKRAGQCARGVALIRVALALVPQ